MAEHLSWTGLAKGLLVLAVLWWAWVGYAWLTSVVDPEEGTVRFAMFAAMAGLLVAALCVPDVYEDQGLLFAGAYAVVRIAHLVLFGVASREDPRLRRSVWTGLVPSTVVGVSLLAAASQLDGVAQGALWALAISLDMAGPLVFGAEGWRLAPRHFAERHGLIFMIALGESIVAIGVGAEHGVDAGVVAAAVLGIALAAAMWWTYFDVVARVIETRLGTTAEGKERNELARDVYSFLHLPMVAGVVLIALGMKKTLQHVDEPLDLEAAAALVGGLALYLLSHVATRLRTIRSLPTGRLGVGLLLVALVPVAAEVDALVALAVAVVLLWGLVAYEATRFAEIRDAIRHGAAFGGDHAGSERG